jgi:hypothetical protein
LGWIWVQYAKTQQNPKPIKIVASFILSLSIMDKWEKRTKIRENRTKTKMINLIQLNFFEQFLIDYIEFEFSYLILSLSGILTYLNKIK